MKTTWFGKDLGDHIEAAATLMNIQTAFRPLYEAAGQPVNMAVFSRYDRRTNIVTVYFSPDAARLAAMFEAKSCEKPSADGIGLLVGDQTSVRNLFPDFDSSRSRNRS